jgi:hypothetical protein
MEAQAVKDYLIQLPDSVVSSYNSLTELEQGKQIFAALEVLSDHYHESKITARAAALQVLFTLEAEEEEFAKLKRHGVQSASAKGTSVTFSRVDSLSPAVVDMLGEPSKSKKGFVGRLI